LTFTTTRTDTAPAVFEEAVTAQPAPAAAPARRAFPLGGSYTARFDRSRRPGAVSGGNYTGGRRAAAVAGYVTGARCPQTAGSYTGTYDAGH